jgi:hypothetical protein
MRTTTSRFSSFVTTVDAGPGHRPATIQSAAPPTQLSVLEQRYPAVVRALTLLWGYPEMNQYFEKVASGQDPSLGIEPAALAELMVLADVHRRICPYQPARKVEDLYGPGRWSEPWKPARPRR